MSPTPLPGKPAVRVGCAGAVVRDDTGRLLLVRRGRAPGLGLWSVPGGRMEPGETTAQAAVREVREETGLEVSAGPVLGVVERPGGPGVTYEITDHECTVVGGALRAGDDADEVRWVAAHELAALPLVDLLVEALTDFGVLVERHEREGEGGHCGDAPQEAERQPDEHPPPAH